MDLRIWPTAINAVQAASHPNPQKRTLLLSTIAALCGELPLLPTPAELFAKVANRIVTNSGPVMLGQSGLEHLLEGSGEFTEEGLQVLAARLATEDKNTDRLMISHRKAIRSAIKRVRGTDLWAGVPQFLDDQWMTPSQLADLLEFQSRTLGLPRPLTYEEVMAEPVFRLFLEGFGAAMFRRTILANEARVVEGTDLLQLLYLGARAKRVLVTKDKDFLELAASVVSGRHGLARVCSWPEFMEANDMAAA